MFLYNYLGIVLYKLGINEKALNDFTKVIEINQHDAEAYYCRG